MCISSNTINHSNACSHSKTSKLNHAHAGYVDARTHTCSICQAFVWMLSRSTFEYNSPLLTPLERAVKTIVPAPAVAQKWALSSGLKAAAKRVSVFALSPVSILESWSVAVKHSSDHQKAWLRKAGWPETATKSTFLTAAAQHLSVSVLLLHQSLFVVSNYSD